jgi:hypothetical protein
MDATHLEMIDHRRQHLLHARHEEGLPLLEGRIARSVPVELEVDVGEELCSIQGAERNKSQLSAFLSFFGKGEIG